MRAWHFILHPACFSLLAAAGLLGLPAPARAAEPLPVEMIPIAPREITLNVRLTGTLEPLDSVDLGFRQAGRISEVAVSEGDSFAEGDVLARVEPLQQQQAVNVAEATLAAAEAARQQAAQAAERAEAMLERGVGTRAARDDARQSLSAAEGQVEQARSALERARRAVEDTQLIAPFDGIVTARHGDPGQVVGAANTVLSLAAKGGLEAVFMTPDLPQLNTAMGTPVQLTPIDVDAPQMHGKVTEISPLIDPMTGSVRVRAAIDDAPSDVSLLGASVRGEINLTDNLALEIPWTALSSSAGSPAVWIVGADGKVSLRAVEIARFDSDSVLVSDGLKAGEIVVGAGSQMLFPGRPVEDGGAK